MKNFKDKTPLFEKGLDTLKEIIWNPLIKDRCFDHTYVAQEKSLLSKNLKQWKIIKHSIHFFS